MKHTIAEQISITAYNSCMIPVNPRCTSEYVQYQIETYRTKDSSIKIGALREYNGRFSYPIGAQVDILPHVVADPKYVNSTIFTNIINDDFLRQYIAIERRQPR